MKCNTRNLMLCLLVLAGTLGMMASCQYMELDSRVKTIEQDMQRQVISVDTFITGSGDTVLIEKATKVKHRDRKQPKR